MREIKLYLLKEEISNNLWAYLKTTTYDITNVVDHCDDMQNVQAVQFPLGYIISGDERIKPWSRLQMSVLFTCICSLSLIGM